MIKIERMTEVTEQAVADLRSLMAQLSDNVRPLDAQILRQILSGPDYVFVARDGERIVGAVLVLYVIASLGVRPRMAALGATGGYTTADRRL